MNDLVKKILKKASLKYPRLNLVKWHFCSMADRMHQKSWRVFAHTYHKYDAATGFSYICFSKAIKNLMKQNQKGIIWHEIGHIIAGPGAPEHRADKTIETVFGITIKYDMLNVQYV